MLVTVLLLGFVLVATVTDLAQGKIYNWTTYSGMLTALLLNVVGDVLLSAGAVTGDQLKPWGHIGAWHSLGGLVACGFLVLFCFVMLKGVGGGDVKLMAMVGAFLGLNQGLTAALWTFVLAACLALIVLIWRVGPWRLSCLLFRRLVCLLRIFGWAPPNEEDLKLLRAPLHLAPSAVGAVVIVRFSLVTLM